MLISAMCTHIHAHLDIVCLYRLTYYRLDVCVLVVVDRVILQNVMEENRKKESINFIAKRDPDIWVFEFALLFSI